MRQLASRLLPLLQTFCVCVQNRSEADRLGGSRPCSHSRHAVKEKRCKTKDADQVQDHLESSAREAASGTVCLQSTHTTS